MKFPAIHMRFTGRCLMKFITVFLLLHTTFIFSQDTPAEVHFPGEMYMLPQTVYVGDAGRLVISLGSAFNDIPAFINTAPADIPGFPDLVINRIELEKRNNSSRLLMDFISYAPGSFALPPMEFASETDVLVLDGIRFSTASILNPDIMVLSKAALPLAVPGTGLFIYGGIGVMVLLAVSFIMGTFWFSKYFGPLKRRLRQKKILASLENKISLLRKESNPDRQTELFSLLAAEFREFLTFLTGIDCRVLSPSEFVLYGISIPDAADAGSFSGLFRRWDNLRFCGAPLPGADVCGILDELAVIFGKINAAGKSK